MVDSGYHSFLLRLWSIMDKGKQEWRASLESVESGEKHGFTSLEELLAYISQLTASEDQVSAQAREGEAQE
jgi:hypothetical protein